MFWPIQKPNGKSLQKCQKKLKNKFLQKIKNHYRTLEIQSRDRNKAIKSIVMVQIVFFIHLVCPKVVSQICRKHIRPDPITSKFVSEITILSRRGGECFAPTRPTMCVGRSPKYELHLSLADMSWEIFTNSASLSFLKINF